MEPSVVDRGSYIEVEIGLPSLCGAGFIDVLVHAAGRFGPKPFLVLCDDPRNEMNFDDAYRIGVDISRRLPRQGVAIVLRGRRTSDAEHFTELVAANRGARVRYFQDVALALSWLIR